MRLSQTLIVLTSMLFSVAPTPRPATISQGANIDDGSCLTEDFDAIVWAYFPPDDTIACDEMMPTIEETMPVANDAEGTVEVEWVGDGRF